MAYTNPKRVTYTRTVAGATTAAWSVSPPPGCDKFRVVDISASVTTAFVGTSTPARFGVGVTGNINDAGYIDFGTASVPSAVNTTVGLGSVYNRGTNPKYTTIDLTGTANTSTAAANTIPEVLGPALFTMTASTGGNPAGAAIVDVTLDWF
jgi:hypothetical protein